MKNSIYYGPNEKGENIAAISSRSLIRSFVCISLKR